MALCVAALGCFRPPPDPDGVRDGALALAAQARRADQLRCDAGDCADWYRIDLARPGALSLEVDTGALARAYALELYDAAGKRLARVDGRPGERAAARADLEPGSYFVALTTPTIEAGLLRRLFGPPSGSGWSYTLESRFDALPEIVYRTVGSEVLEISGAEVLIGAGTAQGIQPGYRGTLLEGGRAIAEIQIVAVYQEGSRARIEGTPSAPITPETRAEVRVPERRR